MAEITAALVKDLREKTGAGMMDSKKALVETGGDIEAAIDWLRAKGLSKAAKKAGRVTAEGLVGVALKAGRGKTGKSTGAVVEVNSETDFVARNDKFQAFVKEAAQAALAAEGDAAAILATADKSGETIEAKLTNLISTIGENMGVRRTASLTVSPGVVASYVHGQISEGVGKIGVLVGLKSEGDADKLMELGRKIAMHVAAASPLAAKVEELDPAVVAREKAIFAEQSRASGKPENIIEKMAEGRLRKFYEEAVLLEQKYVVDGETPVKKVIEAAAKDVGAPVELTGFVRMALGEGIDRTAKEEE